jgi:hypothetical protein
MKPKVSTSLNLMWCIKVIPHRDSASTKCGGYDRDGNIPESAMQ